MQTLVVIPTYNEIDNVERLVAAILAVSPDLSVLVVDDASPDGTAERVAAIEKASAGRVVLMRRPAKGGHGSAYRQGLIHALANWRHDSLFVMDCDFSHDPAAIPVFLANLASADLVVGSRYVPGGRIIGWGPHRHLLSRGANAAARALLKIPVRDCTSGFMGFRRAALLSLPLAQASAEAYAAPVEMKWLSWKAGLKIVEVPITFRDRERGSSKLNPSMILDGARGLWRMKSAEDQRLRNA